MFYQIFNYINVERVRKASLQSPGRSELFNEEHKQFGSDTEKDGIKAEQLANAHAKYDSEHKPTRSGKECVNFTLRFLMK